MKASIRSALLTGAIVAIVIGTAGSAGCVQSSSQGAAPAADTTLVATGTASGAAEATPVVTTATAAGDATVAKKKAAAKNKPGIPDVTRQACLIKEVVSDGDSISLVVDYLGWTEGTGQEGDWGEFSNVNTKLRTIPVAADAKVVVTLHGPDDTQTPYSKSTVTAFPAHLKQHPWNTMDWDVWWIGVKSGKIVSIEEYWIP
ncbi:MAG: hypothetical protein Q7W30_09135 [Coriobacteriia bacterium]|nr:hypothetical protein [Coriobacteriia bacterium]